MAALLASLRRPARLLARQRGKLRPGAPFSFRNPSQRSCTPTPLVQAFSDVFNRDGQLIWAEPRQHTFLASALLVRGHAAVGDAQRNVARLSTHLNMAHWNQEVGWRESVQLSCCLLRALDWHEQRRC